MVAVAVCFFLILSMFEVAASVAVSPATSSLCNPLPHEPILIASNSDFTPANGVVSGNGTATDPYLISNLQIKNLTP